MTQSAALLLAALYTNALHTYYSACRQLPFCTTSAMLGPFKACCNVALLLETTIHIAEDHMHLQVSTSLIDHLFGFFTTTCCLSACCGCASPRACEEARLLLLPIKECRIQKPADTGAVRDTRIVQRELCSETSVGLSAWKLHWFTKQALHMPLQHNRQGTAQGSLLLHVPSLYVQNVFTLLSLLQAV